MTTTLVTGATGTLGTPTTARLRAAGHDVRAFSRRRGPGLTTGDLLTGAGLREALTGVDTVLHLATGPRGEGDVAAARTLLSAAADAGVRHLVVVSIVGRAAVRRLRRGLGARAGTGPRPADLRRAPGRPISARPGDGSAVTLPACRPTSQVPCATGSWRPRRRSRGRGPGWTPSRPGRCSWRRRPGSTTASSSTTWTSTTRTP
ncbi:SDR family oxidoreductase [Geodermatophilus sp. SYSU D00525]